ncbi:MAG TPA: nucleotidyltransferase domain-containing protein [Candidatus Nanoarchaeia archaeon]|nr:nucleotidyltransferase domain-containing protein [Candidatus Nanoarchaeia archaeon]
MDQKQDSLKELFFNFPQKVFGLRELSRLSGTPKSTLHRELKYWIKAKLIKFAEKGYIANESDFWYRLEKRNFLLQQIYNSGLIDYLQKHTFPQVIILFGSGAKGEYAQKSDLDIFLLAKEKSLDLRKFEKRLKRKTNLLFKDNLNQLNSELLNNIINGYKLSGYIKLKREN